MDFAIPTDVSEETGRFEEFIKTDIVPELPGWIQKRELPRTFFKKWGRTAGMA